MNVCSVCPRLSFLWRPPWTLAKDAAFALSAVDKRRGWQGSDQVLNRNDNAERIFKAVGFPLPKILNLPANKRFECKYIDPLHPVMHWCQVFALFKPLNSSQEMLDWENESENPAVLAWLTQT
jgi:hypothetical protein